MMNQFPSVVSSHPGKQVIVYQTVLAFQRSRMLQQHLAAVYYKPDAFAYSLAHLLPSKVKSRMVKQLEKRYFAPLNPQLITSFPYIELFLRILSTTPMVRNGTWLQSSYILTDWVHDLFTAWWLARHDPPTIFFGFQGSALQSLDVAHRHGSVTVLDATHPLFHDEIMAEEFELLGFNSHYIPPKKLIQEALRADYCVTASALTSRCLLEVGVSPDRVFEIPYGIDLEWFHPRPELRTTDDIYRVLYVGKISLHKGFHYLLEAWQNLALPQSELVLVGHPVGKESLTVLQRYDPGLFRWIREVDDIHLLMASADLFVLPSLVEGFGMVTLEAMASGIPVIVTENAQMIVRDGVDGYVIPIRDVAALQECIHRLYEDVSLRQLMGNAARQRAEEFTWERYQSKLVDIIYTIWNKSASHAKSHM